MRGSRPVPLEHGVAVHPPRLFAAIPLPERLREELFAASGAIAGSLPPSLFRRVPPENLHMTLRFFGAETGSVDRERIAALLRERLGVCRPGPLTLKASEVSAFASLRRARIVWVGFTEEGIEKGESGRLLSLQQEVEAVARDIGLAPENRPFVPHVTLGRLRSPSGLPVQGLAAAGPGAPGSAWSSAFTVREFVLFASLLTPGGAVYERLSRFALEAR